MFGISHQQQVMSSRTLSFLTNRYLVPTLPPCGSIWYHQFYVRSPAVNFKILCQLFLLYWNMSIPSGIRQQLGVHVLSVYIVILSLSLAVRLFSREIWAVETPNPDRIAKKGSTTSDWLGRKRGSPVGAGSGRWRKFFHGSEGITFQLFLGRKRHI